jgi:hypothetical protein
MMTVGAKVFCTGVAIFVSLGFGVDAYSQSPAQPDSASKKQTTTDGKVNEQVNEVKPKPDAGHNTPAGAEDHDNALGKPLLRHFVFDQKAIWTSPAHVRFADAVWLVPLGGFTAALLASDRDFSKHLSNSPQTLRRYKKVSDYGIGAMVAAGGGMYLWGKMTSNDHARETGLLAGEAVLDSLVPTYALKYATRRDRPQQGNGDGNFWSGGDSFPSEHASAAWSIASVVAQEYPGFLTQFFAYGGATAISISRIKAKQHFPSDVLVGSSLGWLIGQYVYRAHHDPLVGGGEWEKLSDRFSGEWARQPKNMGSPYVPLDSWIYPAFDRLAAMGYLDSDIKGMRPWTRLECARLLGEAEDHLSEGASGASEASRLYNALANEFASDLKLMSGETNRSLRLESVYTRITGISGQALTDGYHFGQTIINDFGRPYAEGFNNVTGFSGWASAGPFVAYVRGEYQHAPSLPALPLAARQVISGVDGLPLPPATPVASVNQFNLLDSYVALNLENWQISFGKQSLWWGPGEGGPMTFSDNAEPIMMFRINRVSPFKLPSILGWLGPIRTEFFLGQLSGQQFEFRGFTSPQLAGQWGRSLSPQPLIDGLKISFKPTRNFEFSISNTTLFGGPGFPFNWHSLVQTFSPSNTFPGDQDDPGDRRSGLDFTYRLPWMRNWLTFYVDGFSEDQLSPIAYWDRSFFQAGLYLARIPGIPKLDLRVEGVYTDPPISGLGHGFVYSNLRFRNGYTNEGDLIGSWIGRQGQGGQAWSTYWLSSRNKIQMNYRHQKVSEQFIPFGGTVTDLGIHSDIWIRNDLSFSGGVQFEKWLFPALSPGAQSNLTTSIQMTFWPRHWRN